MNNNSSECFLRVRLPGALLPVTSLSPQPRCAEEAEAEGKPSHSALGGRQALESGCSGGWRLSSSCKTLWLSCGAAFRMCGSFGYWDPQHQEVSAAQPEAKLRPPASSFQFLLSPFLFLRILSKVENLQREATPGPGDCPESLGRSGLQEEGSDLALPPPSLERPLSLGLGLVTETCRLR